MQVWGLTGGIASGKSTVADMFLAHGIPNVDADALYHTLLAPVQGAPSRLAAALGEAFPGVLRPDGSIDRVQLGQAVFADADARRRLDALTHPVVASAAGAAMRTLQESGAPHMLYDVPLLFEKKLEAHFAGVVLVWVPRAVQEERLVRCRGLSADEALLRLEAQLPLDQKRAHARWVIDNSGSRAATEAQVAAVAQALQAL